LASNSRSGTTGQGTPRAEIRTGPVSVISAWDMAATNPPAGCRSLLWFALGAILRFAVKTTPWRGRHRDHRSDSDSGRSVGLALVLWLAATSRSGSDGST
jgi:hypothetical protein